MSWGDDLIVSKLASFETQQEADQHVVYFAEKYPEAFVTEMAEQPGYNLKANPAALTVAIEFPEITKKEVNDERNRRIASGFVYGGNEFQTDAGSRENIGGAQGLSLGSMIADPTGDLGLRWADPNRDFTWTATDNTEVTMTAAECQAFCQAAMQYKTDLIKSARVIKNINPMPGDYADDSRWPDRQLG